MSLRPPSTSPSPSPGPHNNNSRASLQPQPRASAAAANLAPIATRPNFTAGARPTSELLGVGSATFQTPESEAIDQWFENLQNYEATLEEMAAASLDANFKEELSAIEQWFRVLSEAERTAALYSLLQHSTQVQIRFFITVLQQMARSDPMTAILSPAIGSMQNQMEAKLASMGLKSPGMPPSPSVRSFSGGTPPVGPGARASVANVDTSNFLSPDSAQNGDAAAALAHSRAKLKASNAAHRLSAPGPLLSEGGRPQSLWTQSTLAQVAERTPSPATSDLAPSSGNVRPKSTDFTGLANQFARTANSNANNDENGNGSDLEINLTELRLNEQLSPMVGGNWASMVNTPLVPMFDQGRDTQNLDSASAKLANWSMGGASPRGVVLDDAKKFRRDSKGAPIGASPNGGSGSASLANSTNSKKEDSNLAPPSGKTGGSKAGSWRSGARSPALSNVSSNRFGGSDTSSVPNSAFAASVASGAISPGMGLGMGMGGFGGMFNGMGGMAGMANMQQNALEAQILAAQLNGAFSPSLGGQFPNAAAMQMGMGQFQMGMGNMGMGMGVQGQPGGPTNRVAGRGARGATTPTRGGRTPTGDGMGQFGAGAKFGNKARPAAKPKAQLKDEDVNAELLNDIPTWFHTLRLHKYTPVVSGRTWRELCVMNDAELEKIGISALGARRKLLKHFVVVRNRMGVPHPPGAETGENDSEEEEGGAGGGGDEE